MKLLILTQYFAPEPGAAQVRLAGMVRELKRLGHEVEVITALPNYPLGRTYPEYRGSLYRRERWEDVPLHRLWSYASLGSGLGRVLNYASFACTSLFGILRARRPDYLFVESPPPLLAVSGILAARRWRVPVIVNVSDLWPDTARDFGLMRADSLTFRAARRVEQWVYRRADYVCAVTEGIRERLLHEKQVPAERILFLPNGVDIATYDEAPCDHGLKQRLGLAGKQVLVYPGTLGYAHDAGKFVSAAAHLQDTNVHLLFVGGGSAKPQLAAAARQMRLENVSFLDPVSPEKVCRFLSIATCGLVSVRDAAILKGARPAKMFVIMSCGKPVIYAGSGEGADLLAEARAGIQIASDDPQQIATAIRQLVADPVRRRELGRQGRQYVVANFSWNRLVSRWLQQLNDKATTAEPAPLTVASPALEQESRAA